MIEALVDVVTEVWTWVAIVLALGGGLLLGWTLARSVNDRGRRPRSAGAYGRGVGMLVVAIGLLFWAGQAVETYASDDPNWPRVVSRFGIWVIYALAAGFGTWVGLARFVRRGGRLL